MSNWQPGDVAIIEISSAAMDVGRANGKRCRLTKYIGDAKAKGYRIRNAWDVDIDGTRYIADQACFRRPPLEPGSWEDMKDIWTPEKVEVIA